MTTVISASADAKIDNPIVTANPIAMVDFQIYRNPLSKRHRPNDAMRHRMKLYSVYRKTNLNMPIRVQAADFFVCEPAIPNSNTVTGGVPAAPK